MELAMKCYTKQNFENSNILVATVKPTKLLHQSRTAKKKDALQHAYWAEGEARGAWRKCMLETLRVTFFDEKQLNYMGVATVSLGTVDADDQDRLVQKITKWGVGFTGQRCKRCCVRELTYPGRFAKLRNAEPVYDDSRPGDSRLVEEGNNVR